MDKTKGKGDKERALIAEWSMQLFREIAKHIHYRLIEECRLPDDPPNNAKARGIILEGILCKPKPPTRR